MTPFSAVPLHSFSRPHGPGNLADLTPNDCCCCFLEVVEEVVKEEPQGHGARGKDAMQKVMNRY